MRPRTSIDGASSCRITSIGILANHITSPLRFGGKEIAPSDEVKWVGLWLDKHLNGKKHIATRAALAAHALNTAAIMHNLWSLRPLLIRDLTRSTVLPCADYGVSSFLPLLTDVFKPLDNINKSVACCITGAFRTAAWAVLEKEAALLLAQLCIERTALNAVASYLTLPASHSLCPLLHDATASASKSPKLTSILHFVEHVPGTNWPSTVPARGQHLRKCGVQRTVGDDEDPSALFDPTLGMEPIVPVYATPWTTPLPVTMVILPKDDALRALDIALADERCHGSRWFTDRSLLEGRAGGAAVRVEDGMEMEYLHMPLGNGQVCEGGDGGAFLCYHEGAQGRVPLCDVRGGLPGRPSRDSLHEASFGAV
ncbi:hypothetical protein B0H17DRAFT_1073731 [Mycena rosella]|uniref:Uncharacterized protein n=1 Tax=Mycena rosella TaxID=1033263 RepID=A0AAD7GEL9_MYCRO|nr:hypothetical protein B0H17DRAFT_1073731 [Mycena rosella]